MGYNDDLEYQGKISTAMAPLKGTPKQLAELVSGRIEQRARIRSDTTRTQEFKRQELARLEAYSRDAFSGVKEKAQKSYERARSLAESALRAPTAGTQDALLREMQLGRAWSRQKSLLDSGAASVDSLIAEAGKSGDLIGLDALRQEYPSYYRASQGSHQDERLNKRVVEDTMAQIEQAQRPHLPTSQRQLREMKDDLERGNERVQYGLDYVESRMGDGWEVPSIPGWGDDEVIDLPTEVQGPSII